MKILPLLIASLLPWQAVATVDDFGDEIGDSSQSGDFSGEFEGFYGDEDFVTLSTGTKKSLSKVPSVASVITASQIRQMGARTLSEVLATVPGLHVSHSSELLAPKFIIRGISSTFNPHTLVLVDNVPISSAVRQDRHAVWGFMPVNAIERIEIIRGPGSALHGADAFSGVINIITKQYDDIDKAEFGARVGRFNTYDVWALTKFDFDDFKVSITAEYTDTEGHDGSISRDAQTNFDDIGLFNPVSLAPGQVNVGAKGYDLRTSVEYKDFQLQVGYQNRNDVGTGQGGGKALDPKGKLGSDKLLINFTYHKIFADHWDFTLNSSHYRSNQIIEENTIIFPPGAFFGAFPDGLIGNPSWYERNNINKFRVTYDAVDKHNITFGAGYRTETVYRVTETKNFDAAFNALSELIDVSDTPDVFLPETGRHSHFIYIQDEYKLMTDWELTAGIRYDNYSNFGKTYNPRLALVWETSRNLSTKLLYGSAFRAPGVTETSGDNNPVALGNSDIQPETIDTYELAFNYVLTAKTHIDFNTYLFQVDDLINFVPDVDSPTATAQNVGKLKGYGVELEVRHEFSDELSLLSNVAYQKTEDKLTDADWGNAPGVQYYAQLDWEITDFVELLSQVSYIGSQKRDAVDPRDSVDSSVNVSLTMNIKNLFRSVDLQLQITNLFDDDIRQPSAGPSSATAPIDIPDDLPEAGRAFYIGLTTNF